MLNILHLVSGISLLTTLKVNILKWGSQDTRKAFSIGTSSGSKCTVFVGRLPEDISFKTSRLLGINFSKWKPPSFNPLVPGVP